MKITRESPATRSADPRAERPGQHPGLRPAEPGYAPGPALSFDAIQQVRDFTARKTLEQAHAFVSGLTRLLRDAEANDADRALLRELERVGVTALDAEELAHEAAVLMERMADRDRKAEIFHAAVKEAGQSERAMYQRLAALARVLRAHLGGRSSALAKLGVPPDSAEPETARPKAAGKAIYSAAAAIK